MTFANVGTRDLFDKVLSKAARRLLPMHLMRRAMLKLQRLNSAGRLNDVASVPGNRLEMLRGERAGQFSIRLNERYRICFTWRNGEAQNVEIVDYR